VDTPSQIKGYYQLEIQLIDGPNDFAAMSHYLRVTAISMPLHYRPARRDRP
jgi:hypothetical protein